MVGLLDLLNQEKAERAAERRAQFVLQQHLGGQGTVPLSQAGDSTLVMMKKAMNMSKLGGGKERGGEAGQQAGQTLPRHEAPQFHENRHMYERAGRTCLLNRMRSEHSGTHKENQAHGQQQQTGKRLIQSPKSSISDRSRLRERELFIAT